MFEALKTKAMKSKSTYLMLLLLVGSSFMIRRHDVDDQKYLDLGKNGGFEALAIFNDGNGTLIDEQWIITAAHVADDQRQGSKVTINGQEYAVAEVIPYPFQPTNDFFEKRDVALIKLDRKVEGVTPVRYAKETPAMGSLIYLVGNGDSGNGKTGPTKADKLIRAATNTIDSLQMRFVSFGFAPPGSKDATELEGIPGPGDSGGPALIGSKGNYTIVGISSFETPETREQQAKYGTRNFYPNVAYFAHWIETTLEGGEYYKTTKDGKEIVSIRHADGSFSLSVDGKKAVVDELIKYGEAVRQEYMAVKQAMAEEHVPDENDPQIRFQKFMEQLAEDEAGIDDLMKAGGFSLDKMRLLIGGNKMSDNMRDKALAKFEEIFGQGIGNQRVNVTPAKN